MASHSSILVWEIPWTGDPGGQRTQRSMGSQRAGHDLATEQQQKTEKGKVFYKYETLALLCNYNTFLSVFSQFPNMVNAVYLE